MESTRISFSRCSFGNFIISMLFEVIQAVVISKHAFGPHVFPRIITIYIQSTRFFQVSGGIKGSIHFFFYTNTMSQLPEDFQPMAGSPKRFNYGLLKSKIPSMSRRQRNWLKLGIRIPGHWSKTFQIVSIWKHNISKNSSFVVVVGHGKNKGNFSKSFLHYLWVSGISHQISTALDKHFRSVRYLEFFLF